jgi:hypothetical protein
MIDVEDCEAIGGLNEWQGKPKYSKKTCPSAALSTKDRTWLDPGSNLSHRSGKPLSNGRTYDTA